jgi:hypothetical protein
VLQGCACGWRLPVTAGQGANERRVGHRRTTLHSSASGSHGYKARFLMLPTYGHYADKHYLTARALGARIVCWARGPGRCGGGPGRAVPFCPQIRERVVPHESAMHWLRSDAWLARGGISRNGMWLDGRNHKPPSAAGGQPPPSLLARPLLARAKRVECCPEVPPLKGSRLQKMLPPRTVAGGGSRLWKQLSANASGLCAAPGSMETSCPALRVRQ